MSKLLFEKLLLLSPSSLPLLFLAKFKSSQLQYLSSFPVFWKNKVVLLRSHIDLSNSLPRVQGLAFPSLVSRMTSFTSEPPLTLRVSLCQLTSTSDKLKNLDFITKLIEQAANSGSKVIFLPECLDYVPEDRASAAELSEPLDGNFIGTLRQLAKRYNVWLSLGGFHERQSTEQENGCSWVSNTHVLVDNDGNLVSCYRKIHLFSISSQIFGTGLSLNESDTTVAGKDIVAPVSTPIGKIGLGICYDVRFPEFSRSLRMLGAEVLTFPSAFTVPTGSAHWEPLLRARAIENQCYVIAAAQIGNHNSSRSSYGHSMVIDPWGKVVGEAEDDQSLISVDIDLNLVETVRKKMDVFNHRRPELYLCNGVKTMSEDIGWQRNDPIQFVIPENDPDEDEKVVPFGQIPLKRKFIFLESNLSRAFVNKKCVLPGHVLVVSKRLALRMKDLLPEEIADLFQLVQKVQSLMEKAHNSSSSTLVIQDGAAAGQTVQHVHVHVIPRQANDLPQDEIYHKLAKHDKNEVQWRDEAEMLEETKNLRSLSRMVVNT